MFGVERCGCNHHAEEWMVLVGLPGAVGELARLSGIAAEDVESWCAGAAGAVADRPLACACEVLLLSTFVTALQVTKVRCPETPVPYLSRHVSCYNAPRQVPVLVSSRVLKTPLLPQCKSSRHAACRHQT